VVIALVLCLFAVSAHAAPSRDSLPVTVAPRTIGGATMPGQTVQYNFVFASTPSCVSLLNISANITLDDYGVGSADLNISSLATTPAYICEYQSGALRRVHPVFSTMFESRVSDADLFTWGFNTTANLDARYIQNVSVPTCAANQKLTSSGSGILVCQNETGGVNISAGAFMSFISNVMSLNISSLVQNIGNWSADKPLYSTTAQGDARWLNSSDQRFNESALVSALNTSIAALNSSAAITALGFNTTAQLDNRYLMSVPYSSAAAGWTNTSTTITTEKIVNVTGALCLGAENGVMPCRSYWGDQESVRQYMSVQMDPFLVSGAETGEYGHWGWYSTVQGTGADITAAVSPDETALGSISLGSGTTNTSNATISTGTATTDGIFINGSSGISGWFTRVRTDSASDGTNNFTLTIGFSDSVRGDAGTDAVVAWYNTATNGGQYWAFRTCSNNACTTNVTTIGYAANRWYDLECQMYNASRVVCYVNGVEAAQITTNIPSGTTRAFWPGKVTIGKTLGTTERRLYIDYYGVYRVFNSPRW
jgi:hypothetical protein